jgi:NAD(P)-dependent dehydrogenase (short-subunit alcohol dehydrogenase family)
MEALRFDDRVVIITGAGRGLGREYARSLAARGAKVVVNDIGQCEEPGSEPAQHVADEIRAQGGCAVSDRNSVTTPQGGAAVVSTALDTFGRLDAVVNNAGIIRRQEFADVTPDAFDATLAVHLKGTIHVIQPAWEYMRSHGGGRLVVTTSASGLVGNPAATSYGSAKAGLVGLTKVLAQEGAAFGIRVNCIAPLALTRMTESIVAPGWVPSNLSPALVAPVVAWLAHDECSVTGEVFSAGGGRVARYFTGLTRGFQTPDLTPELVRDNLDSILSEDGYIVPRTPVDEFVLMRVGGAD